MDGPTAAIPPQPFSRGHRHLQDTAIPLFHDPQHHHTHPLASQLEPSLGLDPEDAFSSTFQSQLDDPSNDHQLQVSNAFEHRIPQPRFHEIQPALPNAPRTQLGNPFLQRGQFGVLTTQPQLPSQPKHSAIGRLQHEQDLLQVPGQGVEKNEGHFSNMKMVPNPPDLEAWRQRLFNVDDTITLSEEDFQIYFPHVDNIYSHRSTQRYKRKPFVSHYWDCRLKGRPPGTPKSDDPNKKKRKRQARERDLCDVKIKITEYFPGARAIMGQEIPGIGSNISGPDDFFATSQPDEPILQDPQRPRPFGILVPGHGSSTDSPGNNGGKFYTIQRVNGNGGNGKGDGVAGPHKHTLEESDRVKKNSIRRHFLKEEKVKKKTQKTYHKKATGPALATVKKHAKDHELKLYGGCFCPFVQRVWVALEVKGLSYQYIEVDPYKKPESLLEVNPRGLVPALRHGDWGCYESTVLMEYLEDLRQGTPLLPPDDPKARAHCRLWSDHINRNIIPAFYRYLQAQDPAKQIDHASELKAEISKFVDAADPTGPFFLGPSISFVDVQLAPWILRMRRVLAPYRGWPDPEPGSRWASLVDAVEGHESVKATTSTDELYLDSYERYAENRPDTSQLAKAINSGRGLP